ncbi:MAG: hypothetical protein RIR70_1247 [Pseudomonadota bacterium]
MTWALLSSVFLAALVSGGHCALMCGGIAAAVETRAPLVPRAALLRGQLSMHTGRVASYVLLGALAGALGQLFWAQSWLPIQRGLWVLAGVLLLMQAVWLLRSRRRSVIEQWFAARAAKLWQALAGRLRGSDDSGLRGRFVTGAAWGLVPCGLIYGVLPIAMLAGDARYGALVMLAFGLGTLPNLMLISALSGRLAQWGHRPWAKWLAAAVMGATAGVVLYRALTMGDSLAKGLCLG